LGDGAIKSSPLNPADIFYIATVADLPDVLSKYVLYNCGYDAGSGIGLYYSVNGSTLVAVPGVGNDVTISGQWTFQSAAVNDKGIRVENTNATGGAHWSIVQGQPGNYDNSLLINSDNSGGNVPEVILNAGNPANFLKGIAVGDNTKFAAYTSTSLAYYIPYVGSGSYEGKISFRGSSAANSDAQFHFESYNWGDSGLALTSHLKMIIDTDYSVHADFKGSVNVAGYLKCALYTDAQLNDVTHAVNTGAGKVQGAQVYNSTQDTPCWAVSNADAGVWVDGAGSTVNSPV